jgi:hypothetical protein
MTVTEKIRQKLSENINLSALELASSLGVDPQSIYAIRSRMKKNDPNLASRQVALIAKKERIIKDAFTDRSARAWQTKRANKMPLSQYILDILHKNPKGLSFDKILSGVQKNGYISNSDMFINVFRQMIYKMVESKTIVKNGSNYFHPKPIALVEVVYSQIRESVAEKFKAEIDAEINVNLGILKEFQKMQTAIGLERLQAYFNMFVGLKENERIDLVNLTIDDFQKKLEALK